MARRIEVWPIERLVPYARNARTHSPEQVAQIAASIVEFGFNAPILVASDAGIVAGHGRLLAARKLGLAEVPVVVLDHLSETQRRATNRPSTTTARRFRYLEACRRSTRSAAVLRPTRAGPL
jgi:ParB-like chromosome segregation protein Spo0J